MLEETVVGDGLDPPSPMGPLANVRQQQRLQAMVVETRAAGATVREFGRRHDATTWDDGCFEPSKLVTEIPVDARLVVDEQFGPVLPIVAFDANAKALALANGTPFGLTGSV